MTYEFDYDTEKVLNQYCLKKTFYRAEEDVYKRQEYEKYVLQPEGDFIYQFQQHTAYQLETDLDGDDQTIEAVSYTHLRLSAVHIP